MQLKAYCCNKKRAIRAISSAGYKAHTEPLFKIYKILKLEDVYNYRLLVFYYNLKNNKVPYYLTSFLSTTSIARERYLIRNPRLQPPIYSHEYISKTCKYRLPVLLNSINNNSVISAKLNEAIANVENISLLKFKSVIKSCMIDVYSYYCNIPNSYICQI